ncbi:MAG: FHIPEP family type III secretion protein [Nitrospiraceae bacterium]
METIADQCATTTKDPEILTEVARQSLGRTITWQYLAPDGTLPIIGLDPRLDRLWRTKPPGPAGYAVGTGPADIAKTGGGAQAGGRTHGRPWASTGHPLFTLAQAASSETDGPHPPFGAEVEGLNEVDSVIRLQALETVRARP